MTLVSEFDTWEKSLESYVSNINTEVVMEAPVLKGEQNSVHCQSPRKLPFLMMYAPDSGGLLGKELPFFLGCIV